MSPAVYADQHTCRGARRQCAASRKVAQENALRALGSLG